MKAIITLLAACLGLAFFAGSASASSEGTDVFKAQRCNSCHSVEIAKIPLVKGDDGEEARDLSTVGNRFDKRFLAGYLLGRQEIDGQKHRRRFAGTRDELRTIVEWLETLK